MNNFTFFNNPSFVDYIKLTSRLHAAIREGWDESPEGESIREQMDGPTSHLTWEEMACVDGLSADFWTLVDPPIGTSVPRTPDVQSSLERAIRARNDGDYSSAFDLIRKVAGFEDPARIAWLRATVWLKANFPNEAWLFYGRAADLDPTNENFRYKELDTLFLIDPNAARSRSIPILSVPDGFPPWIVLKAAAIELNFADRMSSEEARKVRERLAPLIENSISRVGESGVAQREGRQVALALAILGRTYEQLGSIAAARLAYDRGLALSPNDQVLLTCLGSLQYLRDRASALANFHQAVSQNTLIVWPYFFLAHDALQNNRYGDCVKYCSRAMPVLAPVRVRSHLLEWLAISRASLGHPPDLVIKAFRAAATLTPGDPLIASNLRAYERGIDRSSSVPNSWQNDSEDVILSIYDSEFRLNLSSPSNLAA